MGAEKSAGKKVIHYEVYVLVDRRRWTLHARFPRKDRELAIEEARVVDRQNFAKGVKVVREEYSPDTNATDEVLIFVSPRTPPGALEAATVAGRKMKGSEVPLPTGRDGGWGGASPDHFDKFGEVDGADDGGSYEPAKQVSTMNFLGRIAGVTVASLIAALLVASVASFVLNEMPHISREAYDKVMLGAFLLTFAIAAVPLLMIYVKGYTWHSDDEVESLDISDIKPTPRPTKPPKFVPETTPPPEADLEAPPMIIDEPPQIVDDEAPQAFDDEPGEEPGTDQSEARDSPSFEAHRMTTMKFLGGAVAAMIDSSRPQLDSYAKFGIGLIFGGACEAMGEANGLTKRDRSQLIREAFELMGSKPELAANFSDKYDAYLQEPKYLQMIQVGREAMSRYLSGSTSAFADLRDSLEGWVKPQAAGSVAHQSIMAFMFTDIVGSTDMTQSRGDIAAQDIVRRHNAIVRTAVNSFMGKEVKHTGDGIMATFPTISGSVEACIAIQRAVTDHNLRDPSMPLHLRIGINAGEPVSEEDDFFGTTVQLSARMCAAAASDEILCSGVVKELCSGKKLTFIDRGQLNLKGFKDPVQAYEVVWKPEKKLA
jgi:adenylate cyclase